MNWIKKVTESIWKILKGVPGWLLAVAKTPTGKRILVSAVVAGLRAVGITAPFEAVKEVMDLFLAQVGSGPINHAAVTTAVILAPMVDGLFRANDTIQDLKRTKHGVLASQTVSSNDVSALRIVLIGNNLYPVDRYEWHNTQGFRIVAHTGEVVPMLVGDLRNDALREMYQQVKQRAYGLV